MPSVRRTLMLASGAVVAGWLVILFTWQDAPFTLTFDDAYYYFGIGRNLAEGHGSTFDRINLTNGYHPLWMGVCVVAFRAGLDDLDAARALLALQLVAGWGTALLCVSTIAGDAVDGFRGTGPGTGDAFGPRDARRLALATLTTVFLLVVANPFVVKVFANGLESGIVVALYAVVLLQATRHPHWIRDASGRWRLGMGALLALTFLGRTDAALLLVPLGLWCLAEAWRDDGGLAARLGALVSLFAPAGVVIVAYLVVNQRIFGTPVQVSGLVKRAPLDATSLTTFAVFVAVAALVGRHTWRRAHGAKARRQPKFVRTSSFTVRTGWFASFCILLVGYYAALQTQQWLWYFAPVVLYGVVLLVLTTADLVEVALREPKAPGDPSPTQPDGSATRSAPRALLPLVAILCLPLIGAFVLQARTFADPNLRSIQIANRDAGLWIAQNAPDDAVLGSWDAGAVGYFSHARVMNLDGVVNSYEYYEAMRAGTVPAFLRDRHLAFVTNHGGAATMAGLDGAQDPEIRALIGDVYGADAARDARVVYRGPFLYSGTTTGSAGFDDSGTRELVMYVYEIPSAALATPG